MKDFDRSARLNRTPWGAVVSLVILWALTRIVPTMNAEFWQQWDIWQARGLAGAGFFERGGAMTPPPLMGGRMPFISDITYTNHPVLGVWIYAALYTIGGAALCFAAALTLKLGSALAGFFLLRRVFDVRAAWLAMAFLILSPAAMTMDTESNIIGLAAALWPFAAIAAMQAGRGSLHPLWLGFFTFLGGQISWFFLTLVPALVLLALPYAQSDPSSARLSRSLRSAPPMAVMVGAVLSVVVFCLQFLHFVPDLQAALEYLRGQAGGGSGDIPRSRMAISVVFRHIFFVGPALLLCAVASCRVASPNEETRRLKRASVLFISIFVPFEFFLLRFSFVEPSPYAYLLFPVAVLAAGFLYTHTYRPLVAIAAASAVALAAFATIRASVPRTTEASKSMARAIESGTAVDDVVLSNVRQLQPPYEPWDTNGWGATSLLADRLLLLGVSEQATVNDVAVRLKRNFRRPVFVYDSSQPIHPDLLAAVQAKSVVTSTQFVEIPPQNVPLGARFRTWIWKFTGRYPERGGEAGALKAPVTLEFRRLDPDFVSTE